MGNVPTTGYGDNIDVNAKNTINDYYNNPENYSEKLFVVKDPETAKVMRLIQQEQIRGGRPVTVGNPNEALRVFVKVKTPSGGEIRPVGYMPRQQSFDIKRNNLNQTYYEITNRLRRTVETVQTPDALKATLAKDKAGISIDDATAQKLFDNRTTLKSMSDEDLYALLKPRNAFEKYDSSLNNSNISQEMDKHGLNVLVVDKSKLLPVGGAVPRRNPNNPYIALNLNEQDWLRSIDLKENGGGNIDPTSQSTPIEQGIRNIISKIKSQNMAKTSGNILDKVTSEPPPPTPEMVNSPVSQFTPEEIKSLKKQGFSDEMISKMSKQGVKEKPVAETYNPPEQTNLPEFPGNIAPKAPEVPQGPPRGVETVKPPEPIKTTPIVPKTGLIEGLVSRSQLTAEEAAPYIVKEQKIAELSEAAKTRYLKPSEQNQIINMGREIKKFLVDKGLTKPLTKTWTKNDVKLGNKNSEDLLKSALADASSNMDNVKGTSINQTPEVMIRALNRAANSSISILRESKLKLPAEEQKNLENAFKENVGNLIQDRVDAAFQGSKYLPTEGFPEGEKYSEARQRLFPETKEKTPTVFADEQLAKDWNLKLNDKRGLVLDKNKQPVFSDEFRNKLGIREGTSPKDWYEQNNTALAKLYKSSLEANQNSKTVNVKSFMSGLDSASKDEVYGPLFKSIRKIIDMTVAGDYKTPLNKKTLDDRLKNDKKVPSEGNWKLNSIFKNSSPFMQKMFSTINAQGHPISQPKERLLALEDSQLGSIDEKTKALEEADREARIERGASMTPEGSQGSSNADELPEGVGKEDLKGMSVRDINQEEKVHDLTKMESMFSSLSYQELTGKNPPVKLMVNDAIRFGKDFISNYNSSIRANSKTKKAFIDKEGWTKIRNSLLKELEKSGGKGGPTPDGKGGLLDSAWNGIKNLFTAKVSYGTPDQPKADPSTPTTPTPVSPTNLPQTPSAKPLPVQPAPAEPKYVAPKPITTPTPKPIQPVPIKPAVVQPVKLPQNLVASVATAQQPAPPVNVTPKQVKLPAPTTANTIMGVNVSGYAADPKWTANVRAIATSLPPLTSPEVAQAEINRVSPGSKITGKMILDNAVKYPGVDPRIALAVLRQESNLGTSSRAIETQNPGSIWLDDNGGNHYYQTMGEGVEAVFRELYRRLIHPSR